MEIKHYSILDAFKALDDLDAEILEEGKTFDLRDSKEMEEAKQFIEESEKKDETEIQVIDVDADSLDHVKSNEEYIGQCILQCRACKSLRYINMDDLKASEEDPAVYNPDFECPHCHAINSGYTLIGQVGAVEEVKFEKEETVEEVPAEEPAEEEEEVEITSEEPEEEIAADDTADMESTLGNEINSDETARDDTEEYEEETTEEETEEENPLKPAEDEEEEEKKSKKKEESFTREQAIKFLEDKGFNCSEGLVATYAKTLLEEDADEVDLDEEYYYQDTLDAIAWKVEEYSKSLKEHESWINEDVEPQTPEAELAKKIILANNLREDKMNKYGTEEYWIAEELSSGVIDEKFYKDYIVHLNDELKEDFRTLTGYENRLADLEYANNVKANEVNEALDKQDVEFISDFKEVADAFDALDLGPIEEDCSEEVCPVCGKHPCECLHEDAVEEAISRDEFLKNHPQAAVASDKVEDYLEDCLKEAESWIDSDYFPKGEEFIIDIKDIFTKVLEGNVKFSFDVLRTIAKYLMEKLPGMYDYLDFEIESLPHTLKIKYNLKPTNESLEEAKEEEELPADPEAVKTEVHDVINNLVADEIEAIDAYEEAKAEIADTHIEHKDEIVATVDHIEDEEKEHVDELVDAAKKIPFGEEHKEAEEVKVETKPEMVEEPVEESVETSTKEAVNEAVDIHIEGNNVTIKDDSGEEVASILVEPKEEKTEEATFTPQETIDTAVEVVKEVTGEETSEEVIKAAGDIVNQIVDEKTEEQEKEVEEVPTEETPVEEGLEIDEKAINEAINAKLKETGNEDAVFETLSGSFDDSSMLIEGNIISGDLKVPTKFRFENLEENQYKVTNTLSDEEYIIKL